MTDGGDMAGPAYEVLVERGKIREFAQAMQSDSPAYEGESAIVPPTFLTTAARWAPPGARADTGFERARLLHGEQEFLFHGPPPRAGQRLWASERIVDRSEKSGRRGGLMRLAVVVTEFRDDEGTLVAEARSTLIERAKPTADPTGEPS